MLRLLCLYILSASALVLGAGTPPAKPPQIEDPPAKAPPPIEHPPVRPPLPIPCVENHQACIPGLSTCCNSNQHCISVPIFSNSPLNKDMGSCVDLPSTCPLPSTVTVTQFLPPKTCEKQTVTSTVTLRITEPPLPKTCEKQTVTSTTTIRDPEHPPPKTCKNEVITSTVAITRTIPTTVISTSISIRTETTNIISTVINTTTVTTTITYIIDPAPFTITTTFTESGSVCASSISSITEPNIVLSSISSASASTTILVEPPPALTLPSSSFSTSTCPSNLAPIPSIPAFNYRGCYPLSSLGDSITSLSPSNTNLQCSLVCTDWQFFGTLDGSTCICTDGLISSFPQPNTASACCDVFCPGSDGGICGGVGAVSLWEAEVWPPVLNSTVTSSAALGERTLLTVASTVATNELAVETLRSGTGEASSIPIPTGI